MRCALLDIQHLTFIYKYSNSSPWNIASLNIFVRVLIVFCDLFCSEKINKIIFSKNATNLLDEMTRETATGTERDKRKTKLWNDVIRNKLFQTKALKDVTRTQMCAFSSNYIVNIEYAIQCRTVPGHIDSMNWECIKMGLMQ